jgi:hypothetical protein
MPPQVRTREKTKYRGSHETSRPPELPTELTAHDIQSGLRANMKSLALSSVVNVSCRKITWGVVFERSLHIEANLRGPPTPLMFRDSNNHDFSLARALMPLSAPWSIVE